MAFAVLFSANDAGRIQIACFILAEEGVMINREVVDGNQPLKSITLRSVAQSSVLVIFGFLLGRGTNVLLRVVLGRTLGPGDLGLISTVWSWTTMLGVLAIAGLTPTVTRFLALYLQRQDFAAARALLGESLLWVVMVAGGLSALVLALSPMIAARWLGGAKQAGLLRIGALGVLAWALVLWLVATFRGLGETTPSVLAKDVARALLSLVFAAILWWGAALNVSSAVFWIYVLPAWGASIIGATLLWPRIKEILRTGAYRAERSAWVSYGWPLSLSMFLQNVTGRSIDILVLGYLAAPRDVGLYVSALSLAGLLGLLLQGVNYLALPLFTNSKEQSRARQMDRIRMFTFELTIPITLVLMLWPETITRLAFGDAFAQAAVNIPVLAFGYAVSNFVGPVGQRLLAEGKTRWHLFADITSIGTFLLLAVNLVPFLGALGAAIARSFSQIAFNSVAYLPFSRQSQLWNKRFWSSTIFILLIILAVRGLSLAMNKFVALDVLFLLASVSVAYFWLAYRWRDVWLSWRGQTEK
ncbi:MAG: hypothetical protein DRG83_03705 [Deltaproteobacteria bacterium]|nr:MAG: hypothetical protein DRG83_03705 [Deltaproteobacteria bacterium]